MFSAGQFLSVCGLDNDAIFWIFFHCLGLHVLHVTLANLQIFGFEFHLRSLPHAFSR